MKKAILSLLAGLFLLSGCKGLKSTESSTERIIYRDSVVFRDRVDSVVVTEEVRIRDSVIIIKGQRTTANVNQPCDTAGLLKPFDISTENGRVYSREGKIFFECYCADVEKRYRSINSVYEAEAIRLENKIEELTEQLTESNSETKKYKKKALLPWYVWMIAGFVLALFFLRKTKHI